MDMTAQPPNRPTRCRHHFRTCIIAALAVLLISLVASGPTASASSLPEKKCIEIKEDYDLRNAARDSNVFLVVHESDGKEAREHICKKLEATLEQHLNDAAEKGKGTVFAYLEVNDPFEDDDGEWQQGNKNFVRNTLSVKNFPSFLFVSKGMDRSSKYSSHVTQYKSSDSFEMSEMPDVEKFIEKKIGFRLGNDVFNIIFFDSIASRFVSYGDTKPWTADRAKQRLLALLVRFSTVFSFKEPFSSIGKLYNRAFSMSFENGMDYSEIQVKKLLKRLDTNRDGLRQEKIHEFQQKIAILKAFAEPKELTLEDHKQIIIHAALHLGLLLATLLLFLLPGGDSEGEDTEEEEVINAKPVVARAVDDNGKPSRRVK